MKQVNDLPTTKKIKAEENSFKTKLLLKDADEKRYDDVANKLKEGATLGRNEYPKSVADMYELITFTCFD